MNQAITFYLIFFTLLGSVKAQGPSEEKLLPPILLKNEQRLMGNPLATYQAMLDNEEAYLNSPLSNVFKEQKKNMEQFMGISDAGKQAMHLAHLRKSFGTRIDSIPGNFIPKPAISVIEEAGDNHQIIIWGEEHHLPQTRVLFKEILDKLWDKGFRYLAAETFNEQIEQEGLHVITPNLGYYIQDPIFADAVTYALKKGYQLIAYESRALDRDKGQAENIYNKILKEDSRAKIFIIAGRGHIVEQVTTDNWQPMGYWLKHKTGLDPFTIFTQTMTDRLTEDELHPLYKYAIENKLIDGITIFQDSTSNNFLTSGNNYDAYAFFPPENLNFGRPDWMFKRLNREAFKIPKNFVEHDLPVLIQAHRRSDPEHAVPVDQLLIMEHKEENFLVLPKGDFMIRTINENGELLAKKSITIK